MFQSSSTDHSGCNLTTSAAKTPADCFNPHPLITVDATVILDVDKPVKVRFNPHPLITVDATRGCGYRSRVNHSFNPHPLITVDATPESETRVGWSVVSILIH